MKSTILVFLSLMTAIYAITSIIPFNVGEPLWIFFGVLFSYFAGSTCIAYIYVLNTITVTQNIFLIIAAGYSTQKALIAYNPNIAVYHLPWFFYPISTRIPARWSCARVFRSPPHLLLPGMYVRARVEFGTHANAIF